MRGVAFEHSGGGAFVIFRAIAVVTDDLAEAKPRTLGLLLFLTGEILAGEILGSRKLEIGP